MSILRKPGIVSSIKAVGNGILVEHLTPQERQRSRIIINQDSKASPEAYILDIGPLLALDNKWGFQIGDRVLLQGNYVPVPKLNENDRDLGIVQPHDIKCVLVEE